LNNLKSCLNPEIFFVAGFNSPLEIEDSTIPKQVFTRVKELVPFLEQEVRSV
jgi:hypothetical protein